MKNVEVKTKNPMWVVILVALLVIGLGCETVYLLRNSKNVTKLNEQGKIEQNKITIVQNNELINNNVPENKEYGSYFSLNYEESIKDNEIEIIDGYPIYYKFEDMSLFTEIDGEKKIISIGKEIKQFAIGTDYSIMSWEAEYKENKKTYKFNSTLYVLFIDGSIGKISTTDIANKDYKITILSQYTNIQYFIKGAQFNTGLGEYIYAVDNNKKAFLIDTSSDGD